VSINVVRGEYLIEIAISSACRFRHIGFSSDHFITLFTDLLTMTLRHLENLQSSSASVNISDHSESSTAQSSPTVVSPPSPTTPIIEETPNPYAKGPDAADDLDNPLHGWPLITKVIVDYPDFESFQSFKDLHIKSLLYYQAELEELRKELHKLEYDDSRTGEQRGLACASLWATNLESFLACEGEKNPKCRRQWDLVKRIRVVLKEYSTLETSFDFNISILWYGYSIDSHISQMKHYCNIHRCPLYRKRTLIMLKNFESF
jgi:hypothetical protein